MQRAAVNLQKESKWRDDYNISAINMNTILLKWFQENEFLEKYTVKWP